MKTIRDLIHWQYAKIISESAGAGKRQYGFVMDRFKKLASGEISWSTSIREYVKERERPEECIYCGGKKDLTVDHILSRSRGGPDSPDNAVWVCRACNCSKSDKRLYEWYELDRRYLEIEDGIMQNVRSLVGEVEASIKPAKQRLSAKYADLIEVGLTGQQLISKLAVFERLSKNFYSSLDAFKRGATTLSKLVAVLKKLLGVLEAILSSLASVIPAGHPALEAKTSSTVYYHR